MNKIILATMDRHTGQIIAGILPLSDFSSQTTDQRKQQSRPKQRAIVLSVCEPILDVLGLVWKAVCLLGLFACLGERKVNWELTRKEVAMV